MLGTLERGEVKSVFVEVSHPFFLKRLARYSWLEALSKNKKLSTRWILTASSAEPAGPLQKLLYRTQVIKVAMKPEQSHILTSRESSNHRQDFFGSTSAGDRLDVSLFTNFPGDKQWSMLRYARELNDGLERYASNLCRPRCFAPEEHRINPMMGSRWKKHVEFPLLALRHSGAVNHILDHGNAHLINFMRSRKTVITCHDLIPLVLPGLSRRQVFSYWAKVVHLRKAARVITISENSKRDLIKRLDVDPQRIRVIHYGINHEAFSSRKQNENKSELRRKFGWGWPLTLIHVGAPTYYKNVEGVIAVLAELRKSLSVDVHLVRAGAPLTDRQQALIERYKLLPFIHDVGSRGDNELREMYLAADALIFPSWYEGFGLPPIEAMACGLPTVVSNRGSLPEAVADGALQADPQDIAAMSKITATALTDEATRERLIQAGYLQAKKFSWKEAAQKTAQTYLEVYHSGEVQ